MSVEHYENEVASYLSTITTGDARTFTTNDGADELLLIAHSEQYELYHDAICEPKTLEMQV
ncbi:hypothetical protein B0A52_08047 [Exophiala mesophila]|uniref:Uncharacterized protein n=1 Tax=Exophiala mesophila TaxID=212818 RepID=A0A438MZ39_EXOME|nr:hypothetical protein B0A52_08047 [Exophiala mesophila]